MTPESTHPAPASFDELVSSPSPWLSGEGPHAEMVLSTRIRLARNLQSVPFTHRARDEQLQACCSAWRPRPSVRRRSVRDCSSA